MEPAESQQSEYEKLDLIVAGSNAGIWDWRMKEGLDWWSPRLYELLGFEVGEIDISYDKVADMLIHPEDLPALEQAFEEHFAYGKAFRVEIRLRHKSGEYRWFDASGKAAFDITGKPRRMCGSVIDITENKKLRLELEKREFLLEEVGIMTQTGGWEIDLASEQIRCSRELYDIFEVAEDFMPDLDKLIDFYAPEAVPVIRQKVWEALVAGQSWDEELKFITARKQEIWVRSLGKPLVDSFGTVNGLRGVLQNINDRKLAEQLLKASEEKFRKMFELSPVGMTLTDLETETFVEFNRAFLESTGYSAEELKSRTFRQLIPEEFIPASLWQAQILLQKGVYGPFEIESIRKDGQRFPVLLNGILTDDSQGRKLVWSFFQDISEIKGREQVIAALNEELKALNEQKDQLFSIVSHDLKGSVGNTDMILDYLLYLDNSPVETQDIIKKAKQSSAIAKALLEDLLIWARNQMDKIAFEPVNLSLEPVVTHVFHSLQVQADLKHLQLVMDIPAGTSVKADQEMLKVILRNLISNAIKYSHPKGKITLMVKVKEEMVTIAVQDEGIGIKPENMDKLFNRKKHLTTPGTEGEKGSGLGLLLCLEFIRKHGGEIKVESQVNRGSTFTFTLPQATNA